jgi:hypothetical protein
MRRESQEQYEESTRGLRLLKYYREAVNSRGQQLKQCESNDRAIADTHMDVQMFCIAVTEDSFAQRFSWQDPPLPTKQALAKDREAFESFCVQNRYNAGTAGFELARQVIGTGQLSQASLNQAVRSGKLRLGMATPEDLEHREEIRLDQEKLRLQNAQAHELKQEVREGAEARRVQAQRQHRDYEFELKKQAEASTQFPPLPEYIPEYLQKRFGKVKLDRRFLIKGGADREVFKYLHIKYGLTQIEQLLRGEI